MMPAHTPEVTFLTVTCRRDLARFRLQRESIERLGIDIPHVVVVDDDCLAEVQAWCAPRLTVVRMSAVLPWWLRHRQHWGVAEASGWHQQQLVKLAAPALVHTEGIVCLDSDAFFIRAVTAGDFADSDGRLHLYEDDQDLDAEMAAWPAAAMRFLGVPPLGQPVYRYTFAPVVMSRTVLGELHEAIERRHRRSWLQAVANTRHVMEYTLYGVFVRSSRHLHAVRPTRPNLTSSCWWPSDRERLASILASALASMDTKIVLIQSRLGIDVATYQPWAEQAWATPGT